MIHRGRFSTIWYNLNNIISSSSSYKLLQWYSTNMVQQQFTIIISREWHGKIFHIPTPFMRNYSHDHPIPIPTPLLQPHPYPWHMQVFLRIKNNTYDTKNTSATNIEQTPRIKPTYNCIAFCFRTYRRPAHHVLEPSLVKHAHRRRWLVRNMARCHSCFHRQETKCAHFCLLTI